MDKVMKAEIGNIIMQYCMLSYQRGLEECENVLAQDEADCATSSLTALIIKWLEEKNRECHHTGSKVGVGDGEKGYLFNGQYCENCKGRNQLITELIGELE